VPVIGRTYEVAAAPVHETVAVPEPVTLAGLIAAHVRPAGGVSDKLIEPAKPFTDAIVIVEVADCPRTVTAGELAIMVKSPKLKVAVAE
jgi:hypothetical protein